MNNPISNSEVRLLSGINLADNLLSYLIPANTDMLASILDITDFEKQTITDSVLETTNNFIYVGDMPIVSLTGVTDMDGEEILGASYEVTGLHTIKVVDEDGNDFVGLPEKVKVTYVSGYMLESEVTFSNNTTDGETITILNTGTSYIYTFKDTPVSASDIQIGATKEDTAQNFYEKILEASDSDVVSPDKTYVEPFTNQLVITVNHNLAKYPSITVVDTNKNEVAASIEYTSINQVVVTLNTQNSGFVYCN